MPEQPRRACPNCGTAVSFRQIVLGSELFAIRCRQCDARLSKRTRGIRTALAGLALTTSAASAYGYLSWQWAGAVFAVLAAVTVVALLTVRVTIARATRPEVRLLNHARYRASSSPLPS